MTYDDNRLNSDPEAEGIPEYADQDSSADDEVDSVREAEGRDPAALPSDVPLGLDEFGTTPREGRQGDSLSRRLLREEPDIPSGADDTAIGRLVAPDEGSHQDVDQEPWASEVGPAGGGASAEEAAMHLQPESEESAPVEPEER